MARALMRVARSLTLGANRREGSLRCTAFASAAALLALSGHALARQETPPPPPPEPPVFTPEALLPKDERPFPGDPASDQAPTDPSPPTGIEDELNAIRPGVALKRKLDEFAKETNLRIGLAYTVLFQQASGGQGYRRGADADFDFLAKWTAIGAGTKDTGVLAFAAEQRQELGHQTPAELGGQIGSLTPTTNGFNERVLTVKELYWDQRFFEDRFRIAIGRIDPENLFGGHRLQSQNSYFLNKVFSSNASVSFPGPSPAVAAQVTPLPWFYVRGGFSNASGTATTSSFDSFFNDGDFLMFGEAGLTPTFEGLGAGRYRVAIWHRDARDETASPGDEGFTISCDQDIGEDFIVFLRYGYSDGAVTNISNSVQGGVGLKGFLGKENFSGFAASWSEPNTGGLRDEKVLEAFQRFQITEVVQFTVGAQLIIDPSNAPGDDAVGVFSARLRISF